MIISIFNLNINYKVEGDGEAVLLLHGWGSNLTLFNNLRHHLAQTKKVYSLDFPGFGESDEPKEAWDTDKYTDMVIEFIKMNEIKVVSLIGHSFGGRIIIKLANKEYLPFEIEKIVLIDSAGIRPEITLNKKMSFKTRTYKILKKVVSIRLIKKMFPNAIELLKRKFGSADYRAATGVMRDTLVKTVNEDLEPLISNILQPTLLIWGTLDKETNISDALKMESLIKDSGLVKVEGAGHYSFLDNPNLVNSVLDSFLKH